MVHDAPAGLAAIGGSGGRITTELAGRMRDRAHEIAGCRRLAREEGVFGGGSTGINVCAAIERAVELGPGHRVVTVSCDTGLTYLEGPLHR
jgi:cysteine synthase